MNGTRSVSDLFYKIGNVDITVGQVMNLLVTALEGGSNYWYFIPDTKEPSDTSKVPEGEFHRVELCAWGDGHINVCDKEEYHEYVANKRNNPEVKAPKNWVLNEAAMKRGLDLMSDKQYISHFADFITENEDAITADVFLQLSLFGELVYG